MHPVHQPQNAMTLPQQYELLISAGKITKDEAQRIALREFELLRTALLSAPPVQQSVKAKKSVARWFKSKPAAATALPGLYLWGDVGRGKSLLMDLFYEHAPISQKRRVHFHAFMAEVHAEVHEYRKSKGHENPVAHVARGLASSLRLLCLDEFQVTDVADAMILHKLFSTLLAHGVMIITTSNRPPEELYKGGLQREKFLVFVSLIRERMNVVKLAAAKDYRLEHVRALQKTYFTPDNSQAANEIKEIFTHLTHDAEYSPITLEVQGRKLQVAHCVGKVAIFTFEELCERPLGASDYLAIAHQFSFVFLLNVPQMSAEKRNEAKRFVSLIDVLYEQRCKLLCTAAAPAFSLYPEGDGSFEFQRTASRLVEMQTERYLAMEHLG